MSFLGDLFGGGGGGSSDVGSTNVTQSSTFAPEIKPFIEEVLGEAQDQFKTDEFKVFSGPRIAEFDPLQQKAFTGVESVVDQGLASSPGLASSANYAQQAQDAASQGIRSLTSEDIQRLSNPFQQNVIDIEKREAVRDFEGNILPQIGALAASNQSFGGSRQSILEAEAQRNLQEQLADIQARGSREAYTQALGEFGRERQRQGAGASQFGQFASQFPAQAFKELGSLEATGATKQARDQRALDIALSDFLSEEAFPAQNLARYAGLVRGFPVAGTTSRQEVSSLPSVPLSQQLMGLVGTGLGAYNAFSGIKTGGQVGSVLKGMQSGGQIQGGLASLERHATNVNDPLYSSLGPKPSRSNPRALNQWLINKGKIDHLRKRGIPTEQIVEMLNIQISPQPQQRRELSIDELRNLPDDSPESMLSAYGQEAGAIPSTEESMQLLREAAKMNKRMSGAEEYNVIERQPTEEPGFLERLMRGRIGEDPSQPYEDSIIQSLFGEDAAGGDRGSVRRGLDGRGQRYDPIPADIRAMNRDAARMDRQLREGDKLPQRDGTITQDMEEAIIRGQLGTQRIQGGGESPLIVGSERGFDRYSREPGTKGAYSILDLPAVRRSQREIQEFEPHGSGGGDRRLKEFEPHGPGGAEERRMPPRRDYPALRQEGIDMRYPARTFEESLQEFEPAGTGAGREPYDKVDITGILEAINNPRGGRQNPRLPKELRGMEDFELRNLMETIRRNRGWKSSKVGRGSVDYSDPSQRPRYRAEGGLISLANGGQAQSDYPALNFEESEVIEKYSPSNFRSTGEYIDRTIDTSSPYARLLKERLDSMGKRRIDLDTRRAAADKRLAEQAAKRDALSKQQDKDDKRNTWLEVAGMFADYGSGKNFDPRLGFLGNALASIDFSGIKDINSDKAQRAIDELAADERLVTEAIDRDIRRSEQDDTLSLMELTTAGLMNKDELAKAAASRAIEQESWDRQVQMWKLESESKKYGQERNDFYNSKKIDLMKNFTTWDKAVEAGVLTQLSGKTEGGYLDENVLNDDGYGPESDAYLNIMKGIVSSKLRPLQGQGVIDVAMGYNKQSMASDEAGRLRNRVNGLDLEPEQKLKIAKLIKNRMEDGGANGYDDVYELVDKSYETYIDNPDERLKPNLEEYYKNLLVVLAPPKKK
jgi:hypothetical protein